MPIAPGTRFGSYEVVEAIGAGGMGEVWRATDTELKRDVAVKVLPTSFANDADRVARFRREAELLASLNHANIAQVFGLEKLDDQMVIVMELIEGPTLADRIKQGPVPPDEAMGIASQVVSALEVAHANQIVHRDLKPANIKLKDDGTVKVLDFGISKSFDPDSISGSPVMTTPAVTQTGVILGTAAYMSPEQARGKFVDQRTDIWAFGCLLFELLTGQPAFGGEDVMLTLARVLDRDTDLSSIPQSISPAVRHTLKLCLEKDPRRRIADIRDVRLAMEGKFDTEFPQTEAAAVRAPLWRRAAAPVMALALGAVITGLSVWFVMQPDPPMITSFVHPLPEGTRFHGAGDPVIAISPSGDMLAYAVDNGLYVRAIGEIEGRRLAEVGEFGPVNLVFAPDGQSLIYWTQRERRIMRVSVYGGSPVTVTSANRSPRAPTWSEDDTIVYIQGPQVLQVAADGGEEPTPIYQPGGQAAGPSLLRRGELLLYSMNSSVFVIELASEERHELFPGILPVYVDPGYLVYYDAGSLLGRTFDIDTLEFGGPVSLVDEVTETQGVGAPAFALSPSGTLVYLEGELTGNSVGRSLAIANTSGEIERRLNVPEREYLFPTVSPDGRRLAVQVSDSTSGSEIYLYDLDGRSEMRALTTNGASNQHPRFKDATTVLYSSDRDGPIRIYEQSIGGGGARLLTTAPEDGEHVFPVAAPDGALLFASAVSDGLLIFRQLPDSEPEILIGHAGNQLYPTVSADGNYIAYTALSTDNDPRIYIARYPPDIVPYPADAAGVPASPDGEIALFGGWIQPGPDGPTSLIYQDPQQSQLSIVDVALPDIGFSNRRALMNVGLTNAASFAPIPGTDTFVVVSARDGADEGEGQVQDPGPSRIVVIQHWTNVLKERVR